MPHLYSGSCVKALLFALLFSSSVLVIQSYDDFGFEFVPSIFPSDRMPAAATSQGECLNVQLDYCKKEFATALGSDAGIFTNPSLFVALLSKIYKKDVDKGLIPMCNARNDFNRCLGDSYGACTDLFNILKDKSMTTNTAFLLADIYNNIEFDCASGFTQAVTNWVCIKYVHGTDTWKTKSSACFDTYNQTIQADRNKYCSASETYSTCLADIYNDPAVNTCDFNEIMWWECERALRRSKLDGFCDTTTCQSIFKVEPKTKYASIAEQNLDGGLYGPALHRFFKRVGQYAHTKEEAKNNV